MAFEWQKLAACRADARPDRWFPTSTKDPGIADAVKICRGCDVRLECGLDAADSGNRHGIAGGFNCADLHGWRQLHNWLGTPLARREKPAQVAAESAPNRTARCACGTTFDTRHPHHTRCVPCRQGVVDAGPVQQRIDQLRACGVTVSQIAAAAGLSPNTVHEARRRRWVSRGTATRILGVGAEATAVPR